MSLAAILGVQAGMSGLSAISTKQHTESARSANDWYTKLQIDMLDSNIENQMSAMQESYLMNVRDMNNTFANSVSALNAEATQANNASNMATIGTGANMQGSSFYNDAKAEIAGEYEKNLFKMGDAQKENIRRMSDMNTETRINTYNDYTAARIETQMQGQETNQMLKMKNKEATMKFVGSLGTYGAHSYYNSKLG